MGTTRTEAKASLKRRLGGEALVADGLDAGAVQRTVRSAKEVLPEADEIVEFSGAAVFDLFAQSYPPEELLSPLNSADAQQYSTGALRCRPRNGMGNGTSLSIW